jgi:hypothetical protein
MALFGPRQPCPHCGKKVKQPRDPSDYLCPHCRQPGPWASPDQITAWQQAAANRERRAKQSAEFTGYLQQAVGDDILTSDEEAHVHELVRTLEIDLAAYLRANPELGRHVMIAEANGGSLPVVHSSRLIQTKGEVVHLELDATLLKDVTVRQSHGGYSGFSFPIGKTGIRYRVGGYRGQSVEVGTKRVPADTGVLVISSQRAVFLGRKKTIELPLAKLVNLTLFSDGVQFHQSNRQTAPVFVVAAPDVAAAFVHAAAQRLNT